MPADSILLVISLLLSFAAVGVAAAVWVQAAGLSTEVAREARLDQLSKDLGDLKAQFAGLERRALGEVQSAPGDSRLGAFFSALDRWRNVIPGGSSLMTGNAIRELERLRGSQHAARPFSEELIDVNELFLEIVKTALSNSDNTLDKSRKNRAFQAALQELVKTAGLELLEPEPDDPVKPELHFVADTVRGNGRNKNTVDSVLTRGLMRSGRVVKTAEVKSRY